MQYSISDREFEDGCFQGILQVMNSETREAEIYTFVFDVEIRSFNIIRRTDLYWNAPIHPNGVSDYVKDRYYELKEIIRVEANNSSL